MNDCLLLPIFPWTPIVQTRAANRLTRFKWKEILSTLGRECIMKNFRAVLEKSNIEVSLLMHVLGYMLQWTTIFCFGYFIMFKQLLVLRFHKDTFNFVPPMFYVGIWRSHHFMRGATVFWGGHRWPGGPPVASDEKRHPYYITHRHTLPIDPEEIFRYGNNETIAVPMYLHMLHISGAHTLAMLWHQ